MDKAENDLLFIAYARQWTLDLLDEVTRLSDRPQATGQGTTPHRTA
ncbi:hypothetical protein [Embleya sp. NPDC059259]